jgi:hypothetical protein
MLQIMSIDHTIKYVLENCRSKVMGKSGVVFKNVSLLNSVRKRHITIKIIIYLRLITTAAKRCIGVTFLQKATDK